MDGFYWKDSAPEIVNPGLEEQGLTRQDSHSLSSPAEPPQAHLRCTSPVTREGVTSFRLCAYAKRPSLVRPCIVTCQASCHKRFDYFGAFVVYNFVV